MSVVGIDLGTQFSVIAQAKRGGIDIVLNSASNRLTPSYVSFKGRERFMGEAAAQQAKSNYQNTVSQLKRLIGRKYSDPDVQHDLTNFIPYRVIQLDGDKIGIQVEYNDETQIFSPEQLLAMVLQNLKTHIERANNNAPLADSVVSVPAYYTAAQRKALLDACSIANLNCLRLLNDITATALGYGIYKSARNEFDDKPRHVLFVDMGYASCTAAVVAFKAGTLQMVSCVSDSNCGGRDIDLAIAKHFAAEFKSKFGKDPWGSAKARVKLLEGAEKAKKELSPIGVTKASVNIEFVYEERDLATTLTDEQLDTLVGPVLEKVGSVVKRAIAASGLEASALAAVELVGGGVRPRSVRRCIAQVAGLDVNAPNNGLSTTLNFDEAVARGCALMCAILSPLFRVKEFEVKDIIPYPIRVSWEGVADVAAEKGSELAGTSLVLFKAGEEFPRARTITFRRPDGFRLNCSYDDLDSTLPAGMSRNLGDFQIPAAPADCAMPGEAPKVRVLFKVDASGLFTVKSVTAFRPVIEAAPETPVDGASPAAAPAPAAAAPAADAAASADADGDVSMAPTDTTVEGTKRKVVFTKVDLGFTARNLPGMNAEELRNAVEREANMTHNDRIIQETQSKRNEVETYTYNMRSALSDNLAEFVTEDVKSQLMALLDATENWLYEDGFDATKRQYQEKLDELKRLGDPITRREQENQQRPAATSSFLQAVESYKRVVNSTEEKFAHLEDGDRDKLRNHLRNAEEWLSEQMARQGALPLNVDPVLTVASVRAKQEELVRLCNPIATKPKPAPKVEKPAEAPAPAPAPAAETPEADAAPEGAAAGPEDISMDGQ